MASHSSLDLPELLGYFGVRADSAFWDASISPDDPLLKDAWAKLVKLAIEPPAGDMEVADASTFLLVSIAEGVPSRRISEKVAILKEVVQGEENSASPRQRKSLREVLDALEQP